MKNMLGADVSCWSDAEMLDSIQYAMFPNFGPWLGEGLPLMYQFLPYGDDPNLVLIRSKNDITAGNGGRVLFAGELGIYGDCVILDHGGGLTSLYAHLSRIDVSEGQSVQKDEVLGLSGETGLAGGDHLHFAILVSGVYVDPKEWWDPKWVREHVEVRLPSSGS